MPLKLKTLTCACSVLFAASVLMLALPECVAGQDADDPPSRVARLSYTQGSVSFQPAGESDWVRAAINRPFTTGDRLWVDSDSRAELHIGSAAIRLGTNTGFSFLNLDDRTVQIQLSAGTLYLRVRHLDRDANFEVDTPNQSFSVMRSGRYRIEASEDGNTTVVTVRDGQGEASGADRTYTIESGDRATLDGTDSLSVDIDRIGGRDRDDFDEWCETRDRRYEHSQSTRYVSPDLVGYEDLDENGYWRHDFEYGDIWIPTAIPAGWAPYRYGHWAWISPWGWTWVDDASWGYAPFHYGRWVYTRHTWAWVPGPVGVTPVYAPALVAFVGTPRLTVGIGIGGGAAVGWFPLGPREVYVPSYQVSREYVNRVNVSNTTVNATTVTNVYNTTVINNVNTTEVTNITYVNRTAPGAVTAVSESTFRTAQPVASAAVTVNERQLAAAPVITRAEVAPTTNSVLGASESKVKIAAPPPAIVERPVVAKTAPPPPPVSFKEQESALAAHPGRPLARGEVETLRPANVEPAHPMVKQALMPEKKTEGGRSVSGPGANASRTNGQPANQASGALGNKPANPTPVEMPSQKMPNNDRPASAQSDFRGRAGNQPDSRPSFEPAKEQPTHAQSAGELVPSVNPPVATPNIPARTDRPLSAQPEYRPPANNQPNGQPSYRPATGRPSENPSQQPNNRPGQQENTPAPAAPNNRMSNSQPNNQPLPVDHRPNPGSPAKELGSNRQMSTAPSSHSANVPDVGVPTSQPVRSAAPNPPSAPPPAAAALKPTAPPARKDSPSAGKASQPSPALADKSGNTPPHDNKEDKNKN